MTRKEFIIVSTAFASTAMCASPIRSCNAASQSILAENSLLPKGAVAVEYLQSTGTQWIDTGYQFVSATDEVELHYELLASTPKYKWIFGAYDTKRLAIGAGDGGNRRTCAYNSSTRYLSASLYTESQHAYAANSNGVFIDNALQFAFSDFSTSSKIFLFTISLNDPPTEQCSGSRIWSYKHSRNGILIRDFIPVRFMNESNEQEGAMYDLMSKQLFRNQGTGHFNVGTDKQNN